MTERIRIVQERKRAGGGMPASVSEKVKQGNKYIPMDEPLDDSDVPDNWAQSEVQVGDKRYWALMPLRMYVYMGDGENSDELLELNKEIENYESELIRKYELNAGESWLAEQARQAYSVAKLNELIDPSTGGLLESVKKKYGHDKVARKIRKMVSLLTGEREEDVKQVDIGEVVRHIDHEIRAEKKEQDEKREEVVIRKQKRVQCHSYSHYEYRNQYKVEEDKRVISIESVPEMKNIERDIINAVHGDLNGKARTNAINELRSYVNTVYLVKEHPDKALPMEMQNQGK